MSVFHGLLFVVVVVVVVVVVAVIVAVSVGGCAYWSASTGHLLVLL